MTEPPININTRDEFWTTLKDLCSVSCHSSSKVGAAIQTIVQYTSDNVDSYVNQDDELINCTYTFLNSSVFTNHKALARRKLISMFLQEDQHNNIPLLITLCAFLLVDGKHNSGTLEMMQEESAVSTLIKLIWKSQKISFRLYRLFLELLFETCRVQKLSSMELSFIQQDFIKYLFEKIESKEDYDYDPYGYYIIKVLLALNEQYMVASCDSYSPQSSSKDGDITPSGYRPREVSTPISEYERPSNDNDCSDTNNDSTFTVPANMRRIKSALSVRDLEHGVQHGAIDYPPLTLENKVFCTLVRHKSDYRTFGENMVLILNRSPDNTIQLMVLKFLYLVFTTPATYEYLYLNDLKVIVDVFIRELYNLSGEDENLIHTYLRVLHPLLMHTELRREKYKREELVSLLRCMSDNAGKSCVFISETTERLAYRCLFVDWLDAQTKQARKSRTFDEALMSLHISSQLQSSPDIPTQTKQRVSESEIISRTVSRDDSIRSADRDEEDDSGVVSEIDEEDEDEDEEDQTSFRPHSMRRTNTGSSMGSIVSDYSEPAQYIPPIAEENELNGQDSNTEQMSIPSIVSSRSSRCFYDSIHDTEETPTSPISAFSSSSEHFTFENKPTLSSSSHEYLQPPFAVIQESQPLSKSCSSTPPPPPPSRSRNPKMTKVRSKPPPPPPPSHLSPKMENNYASSIHSSPGSLSTMSLGSDKPSVPPPIPSPRQQNCKSQLEENTLKPPPPRRLNHAKSIEALRSFGNLSSSCTHKKARAPAPPPSRLLKSKASLSNLGMSIRNTSAIELAGTYTANKNKSLPPLPTLPIEYQQDAATVANCFPEPCNEPHEVYLDPPRPQFQMELQTPSSPSSPKLQTPSSPVSSPRQIPSTPPPPPQSRNRCRIKTPPVPPAPRAVSHGNSHHNKHNLQQHHGHASKHPPRPPIPRLYSHDVHVHKINPPPPPPPPIHRH